MNLQLLIDSIVRQTTVLMAQLATTGGTRAPLAHIANQVVSDLAEELQRQGLSRKVTADMFGISLRSYQRKLARLKESSSERGRSLWDAILEFLVSRSVTTPAEVLERFSRDSEAQVRGILRDLVESGLVFHSGSGVDAVYRAISAEELASVRKTRQSRGLDDFVWALVYRHGPATVEQLAELVKLPSEELHTILRRLAQVNRVQTSQADGRTHYSSANLFVEKGTSIGWEASVYDHYHAMVRTICARLENDPETRKYVEHTGGSTYSFDVGPGHPLQAEVLNTLTQFRQRASELRERVVAYNEQRGIAEWGERVVAYAGLSVLTDHTAAGDHDTTDARSASPGNDESPVEET